MRFPNRSKPEGALLILGLAALLCAGDPAGPWAFAQSSSPAGSSAADLDATLDPYQRSGQVFYHKLMGKSGADRGQHLWYLKCWICHNEYTIKADPKGAPTLRGLYKRPALMSGQPVNDETVKAKIREGGPGMPAYKYGLNDTDLADLVTYLREKCCWDEENPPANPRYRNP
ncbi:MAG: hypothetical protein A3J28_11405 [Acidobacteria bacterium RIFCSPLOWO2_12_FULL_60_22]|nr:MAG: hypothetical protein A3J28_11405 [Acidobacteria bacterium RIFCSPLOWO2_12_FULL_60_22]